MLAYQHLGTVGFNVLEISGRFFLPARYGYMELKLSRNLCSSNLMNGIWDGMCYWYVHASLKFEIWKSNTRWHYFKI